MVLVSVKTAAFSPMMANVMMVEQAHCTIFVKSGQIVQIVATGQIIRVTMI
jgi:hypothetical protein